MSDADIGQQARVRRHAELLVQCGIVLTPNGPERIDVACTDGCIVALGYDADLTLVDLAARRTIRNDWIASRSGWTPYDGNTVTGWPIHTVVRGQMVVRDEQLMGSPQGKTIRFLETPGETSVSV